MSIAAMVFCLRLRRWHRAYKYPWTTGRSTLSVSLSEPSRIQITHAGDWLALPPTPVGKDLADVQI
jgi:hypothetical protein